MKHLPVSLQPLSDIGFPFNLFQQLEEFPDMWLWWILHHMDRHLLFSIFFFFFLYPQADLRLLSFCYVGVAAMMWGFVVAWQALELQTLELQAFLLMAQCRCCGLRKLRVFRNSLMWWHMWMQEWVCAASLWIGERGSYFRGCGSLVLGYSLYIFSLVHQYIPFQEHFCIYNYKLT